MAKIAFVLLCHKDPDGISEQVRALTAGGDYVAVHFDGNAPQEVFGRLRSALADVPGVVLAPQRVKCGWGEWSLVDASLSALKAAHEAFPDASHFYMLSGDCRPTKSSAFAHGFLDAADRDFIECFDFYDSDWIKTGFKEERLIYRHFFNERRRRQWFYTSFEIQRRLRLKRSPPKDLRIKIGSQWWCLRRGTVDRILGFLAERRDVVRFFKTTWIPDETFFQTLVHHLVPEREIECRTLTFLMFTDYGMPVTFHNDHHDLLLAQDCLFARKISEDALELKARLGALWASGRTDFAVSGEGRSIHRYLTGQGRVGQRFGTRFWDRSASLGAGRRILLVACKKWHLGERLAARAGEAAGIPTVGYAFHDPGAPVPWLGGVSSSTAKRQRHRRAYLGLLFEHFGSDALLLGIDPSGIELARDFFSDVADTRLLELAIPFDDEFVAGHAARIGLASEAMPREALQGLVATLRGQLDRETEALRTAGLRPYHRLTPDMPPEEAARQLAEFLDLPAERLADLTPETLFHD